MAVVARLLPFADADARPQGPDRIEWTWGMFIAADITHLRFTRTQESERDALVP